MLIPKFIRSPLLLSVACLWRTGVMATGGDNAIKRHSSDEAGSDVRSLQSMRYLAQDEAIKLDQELFNEYRFSVDQLVELAGLSVATAIAKVYSVQKFQQVLIICGPGNNGADGLVAARHLSGFGYEVAVYYPKRKEDRLYDNLLAQCVKFGVTILSDLPAPGTIDNKYKILVDSLFGFSFKPPVRDALKPSLDVLIDTKLPVCSVDIPSGWDVEKGPDGDRHVKPSLLISLSVPKLCARPEFLKPYNTKHYLGGRFIPKGLISMMNLTVPSYPEQDQVVQLF